MSWLFSQALVEAFSAGTSLDTEPSAQLSVMPTQHKFWRNGKTMEPCDLSQFGLTLKVLTATHGEELLTAFVRASHAKTLARPGRARVLRVSEAGSGAKPAGSFAKYDLHGHSWKTAQCSLLGESTEFSGIWPKSGSMRNGECWARETLAPTTSVNESGSSLPTPSGCRSGKNHVIGRLDEWGGSSNRWRGTDIGKISSPAFEEWVMGWPEQWTALMPLEMDKFHEWQRRHSTYSAPVSTDDQDPNFEEVA